MRPVTSDRNVRRNFNKAIGDDEFGQNPYASMYMQAFGNTQLSDQKNKSRTKEKM